MCQYAHTQAGTVMQSIFGSGAPIAGGVSVLSVIDLQKATIVRNRWYYGWGVRLTARGWLYNVSGFDAVEILLKNGRTYRIGTDKPAKLLLAIEIVISNTC